MKKSKIMTAFALPFLLAASAAFPAFAAETIDLLTLEIWSGITVGTGSSDLSISVQNDGCYVEDYSITNQSDSWKASDKPTLLLTVMADEDYEFVSGFSADHVEILEDYGSVTKVTEKDGTTLSVYITLPRVSSLNDKNAGGDDSWDEDSYDKNDDDDEDYDDEDYDDDEEAGEAEDYELYIESACWDSSESGAASWDECSDARRYLLRLYLDEEIIASSLATSENTYDFSEYMDEAGTYYFEVRGLRNGVRGDWTTSDELELSASEAKALADQSRSSGKESTGGPGSLTSGSSFSGQNTAATDGAWLKDAVGYWWCNPDKTYPINTWKQINGKWYFFNEKGYREENKWILSDHIYYFCGTDGAMLINSITPDGFYVGGDGAWIH